jgi:hypothetical protein
MALSPPSYVSTPHVAFARVWINGELITLGDDGLPNSFQSLSFNRIPDSGGYKMNLKVVDRDWIE